MREALTAQFTGGLSPAALALAFFDWSNHLAMAQGKRMELGRKAGRKAARLAAHLMALSVSGDAPPCIDLLPGDNRFSTQRWRKPPFCFWSQALLLPQQWWHNVTREVPGVTPHHEEVVSFVARQLLDIFSPSNIPFANTEVIAQTQKQNGIAEFLGRLASTRGGCKASGRRSVRGWRQCRGHARQGHLSQSPDRTRGNRQ